MPRRRPNAHAGPSTTSASSTSAAEPPPYEPPHLPLTVSAAQKLHTLARDNDILQKIVQDALELLTNAAGDLGERTPAGDGVKESGGRTKHTIANQREILCELEKTARSLVDASVDIRNSKQVILSLAAESMDGARIAAPRRQRKRQRAEHVEGDDESGEASDEEDEVPVSVEEGLLSKYKAEVKRRKEAYSELGLKEKYLNVKEYVDFRRVLWDSQHPNEPMPSSRNWFNDTSTSNDVASEDEDGDLKVSREKQSFKCPITQAMFVKPVTSTICPHSFEQSAIMGLMQSVRPRGKIRCPASGCNKTLTADILKPDKILERKLRREIERQERERDDMEGHEID